MRTLITPGRLYQRLSSDFRQVCCTKCARYSLPLPSLVDDHATEGAWRLGQLAEECDECAKAIEEIVKRHQGIFDLLDPVSPALLSREFH